MESYHQVHTTTPQSRFESLVQKIEESGLAATPGRARVIAENISDDFAQFLLSERPMYDVKTSKGTKQFDARDGAQAVRDARKLGHNVNFNAKKSK